MTFNKTTKIAIILIVLLLLALTPISAATGTGWFTCENANCIVECSGNQISLSQNEKRFCGLNTLSAWSNVRATSIAWVQMRVTFGPDGWHATNLAGSQATTHAGEKNSYWGVWNCMSDRTSYIGKIYCKDSWNAVTGAELQGTARRYSWGYPQDWTYGPLTTPAFAGLTPNTWTTTKCKLPDGTIINNGEISEAYLCVNEISYIAPTDPCDKTNPDIQDWYPTATTWEYNPSRIKRCTNCDHKWLPSGFSDTGNALYNCCGDDGQLDTGVILNNESFCYVDPQGESSWKSPDTSEEPFKLYTATSTKPDQTIFTYDILSNTETWASCDTNDNVPASKNGNQKTEGQLLDIPTVESFRTYIRDDSGTYVEQGATTTITAIDTGYLTLDQILGSIEETIVTPAETISDTQTTYSMPSNFSVTHKERAAAFICADEDQNSKFLECCVDRTSCKNQNPRQYVLPGSTISILKDFKQEYHCSQNNCPYVWQRPLRSDDTSEFTYLTLFLNDKKPSTGDNKFNTDLNIRDWSQHEYLEFYVYALDDLSLDLELYGAQNADSTGSLPAHYAQLKVIEDVLLNAFTNQHEITNGLGLKKWMHVKIPISTLQLTPEQLQKVNIIRFRINKANAKSRGPGFSITGINYDNIMLIDKIGLVKTDTKFICDGKTWINENDLNTEELACNALLTSEFTGNQCCQAQEFYKDENTYCWNTKVAKPNGKITTESIYRNNENIESDMISADKLYVCNSENKITLPQPASAFTVLLSNNGIIKKSEETPGFICTSQNGNQKLVECAESKETAKNKLYQVTGEYLSTIEDFNQESPINEEIISDDSGKDRKFLWNLKTTHTRDNYYARIFLGTNPGTTRDEAYADYNFDADYKIKDWSGYNFLNFYIYAEDDLNLNLFIGNKPTRTPATTSSHFEQVVNITNIFTPTYAKNGASLKKWIKVQIPLTQIRDSVNLIEFRADRNVAATQGSMSTGSFNIYTIDKIYLSKGPTEPVCTGTEWAIRLDDTQAACESVPGNTWAENKCCEQGDYYQIDDNYCWNGNVIEPGTAISDVETEASPFADLLYGTKGQIPVDKKFYACSDQVQRTLPDNQQITTIPKNTPTCNIFEGYVCSPNNKWSNNLYDSITNLTHRNTPKPNAANTEQACCPNTYCWTGQRCIQAGTHFNQNTPAELFPDSVNILTGPPDSWPTTIKGCILDEKQSAGWLDTFKSEKWDKTSTAYCSEKTCWSGTLCAGENYFENNYYCIPFEIDDKQLGVWNSRTKLLSAKLLEIADSQSPSKFTLYCDDYEKALTNYMYDPLIAFLNKNRANNFCILNLDDQLIVSATLNQGITEADQITLKEFSEVVNLQCEQFPDSDDYQICTMLGGAQTNGRIWYNTKLNSVLYSQQPITDINALSSPDSFQNWLEAPVQYTINLLKNIIIRPLQGLFVDNDVTEIDNFLIPATNFDTVYINKLGEKEITGIVEGPLLSVGYKGFQTDLCKKLNSNEFICQPIIDTTQSQTRADYRIFTTKQTKFDKIWQPTTSMLRLATKTPSSSVPAVAEISSPTTGTTITTTDKVTLEVKTPQPGLTYYWDTDSTQILNGEVKGASITLDASQWFSTPAQRTITLIAVNSQGECATAATTITIT